MNKIPVELTDLSISQADGKKLSYCGYEFEVPWQDIDEAKTRIDSGNKAIVTFRSGNVLLPAASAGPWPRHNSIALFRGMPASQSGAR
jgi:hypothetical protein